MGSRRGSTFRLVHRLPDAAEEQLVALLDAPDYLGSVSLPGSDALELRSYFADPLPPERLAALAEALPEAELLSAEAEAEEDWLASYRRTAEPFGVATTEILRQNTPILRALLSSLRR